MSVSNQKAQKAALLALLKETRQNAGLRQKELANVLLKPQSYVSKVESGERRIDILELRQFCQACGLTLAQFTRRLEAVLRD